MSPGRWSVYWRSQLSRIYPPIYVLFVGLESSGKTSLLNLIVQQSTLVSSSTVVHQSRDPNRQPDGDHVSTEERPCQQSSTSATVGFDTTRFNANRRCFIVFDMSGQSRYRNLWSYYFRQSAAIVFVVDSADRSRLRVARDELHSLLENRKLNNRRTRVPVLIFANKCDRPESVDVEFLSGYFRLKDRVINRPLKVVSSSVVRDCDGPGPGFAWLMDEIDKCRGSADQRESSNFVSWL